MSETPAPYSVEPTPAPPSADSPGQAPKFQQILATLRALYPQCFFPADTDPKPLKIGIHKDLAARGELPEAITATRLRNFLAWYVRRYRYRKVLIHGGPRVDLEGNAAGEVTEEHSL